MRAASIAVILAVCCLALAGTAGASRRPTRGERSAITRVARGTPHAGTGKVHVSNIRISTVGPWASATVTVYFSHQPDEAEDVLHKVHGKWRLTNNSPGSDGEWCGIGMPRKDQRNLGFPACHNGI